MAAHNNGPTMNGFAEEHHPNGRPFLGGLIRPKDARLADYALFLEEPIFPETNFGSLLKGLLVSYLIKQEHRMGWARKSACDDATLQARPNESVGAHQWGVNMLIVTLSLSTEFQQELPNFDHFKAMQMGTLHDVPEVKTGDITPVDPISKEEKHRQEKEAMDEILGCFPEPVRNSLHIVYNTYETRECIESKFVKDCDRLDFMITAFLLERQGFTGFEEFYINTIKEGFSTKVARGLAETLMSVRNDLQAKKRNV